MTSTFTTGLLDTQLFGFVNETYTGGKKLDALVGSLAGTGVSYAMTGDATFNILNAADLSGGKLRGGLLEMHLGDSGFGMNLGSGGADISAMSLIGAAGGFKAWGINARLALSKQEEAHRYTVAMRTLSSTGNNADLQLYYELLNGNANIIENPDGAYTAKTTMVNGIREISLGNIRDILSSELSMGVLLSHEANRNGVYDGYEGQVNETARAINGHLATALMLESTYGEGILGGRMSEEAAAYWKRINDDDWGDLGNLLAQYDSSGDFWLLKKDGTIVDDGSADLHWEAVERDKDKSGAATYKTIMAFTGKNKEESLVELLGGAEKAKELLAEKKVKLKGDETIGELGKLLIGSYSGTDTSGALTIGYENFKLNRDYKAIYTSYSNNKKFIDDNMYVHPGNLDALRKANGGEDIPYGVKGNLEYYVVLTDYYNKTPEIAGTKYINDPAGYLLANTTVVSGHGLTSPVRVSNEIAAALISALDDTIKAGGEIPAVEPGGGLGFRFMKNTEPYLELSEHAFARAVDFAPGSNGQYFVPTDPYLDAYLEKQMGMKPGSASGYTDQYKMASLISGYEGYLDTRLQEINKIIAQADTLSLAPAIRDSIKKQYEAEKIIINTIKRDMKRYPKTSFSMEKTFVESMRKSFRWGGDWWRQKDYMHFEMR
jgi:hypothetical protein